MIYFEFIKFTSKDVVYEKKMMFESEKKKVAAKINNMLKCIRFLSSISGQVKKKQRSQNDFSFPFPFPFLKISSSIKKSFLFGYPKYNSRFFSFLGYPKIFSGTQKETNFLKIRYFHFWKRLGTKKETKIKETETSGNRPKFGKQKSRFHYLCYHGT